MAELKSFEVIMRINFVASDGEQICAHAERVQELIRCRECKHYRTHISCVGGEYDGCDVWLDNGNEIEVKPDDFCSYAERRTDG